MTTLPPTDRQFKKSKSFDPDETFTAEQLRETLMAHDRQWTFELVKDLVKSLRKQR